MTRVERTDGLFGNGTLSAALVIGSRVPVSLNLLYAQSHESPRKAISSQRTANGKVWTTQPDERIWQSLTHSAGDSRSVQHRVRSASCSGMSRVIA